MTVTTLKRASSVAAVVIAGVAAGGALAAPRAPVAGHGASGGMKAAMARLDLSAEQRERMRAIAKSARPGLAELHARRLASKAALDAALQAPNPDPAAVGSALLKTRSDGAALRAERKAVRERTLSVLTPDQRASLDGYLAGVRAAHRRAQ